MGEPWQALWSGRLLASSFSYSFGYEEARVDQIATPKPKRKPLPPHWYYISRDECVLCGRSSEYRERRFTPRPEAFWDRHEDKEYACSGHFM